MNELEQQVTTRPEMNIKSIIRDLLEASIAVLVVMGLLTTLTGRFVISGTSMSPAFETGQYLVTNRTAYSFDEPQRGDIVVFHSPVDPTRDLLKRIVGLPGETIEFRNQQVYINGELLPEPYAYCDMTCGDALWQIDNEYYFLLGDNRDSSVDSRTFGPVSVQNFLGKAWLRYYPFSEMKWLN